MPVLIAMPVADSVHRVRSCTPGEASLRCVRAATCPVGVAARASGRPADRHRVRRPADNGSVPAPSASSCSTTTRSSAAACASCWRPRTTSRSSARRAPPRRRCRASRPCGPTSPCSTSGCPDGDGVEVCREIRSQHPEIACLMLTSFADDEALFDAIMAGAAGYVLKQVRGNDLVDGGAQGGRRPVPARPGGHARVLDRLRAASRGRRAARRPHRPGAPILDLIGRGPDQPTDRRAACTSPRRR